MQIQQIITKIKSWRPTLKDVNTNRGWYAIGITIVIVVIAWIVALVSSDRISPVPKSILSSVSYPVYYPSDSRLPEGYALDKSSIELVNPKVVILVVKYDSNNMVVFNEQANPGATIINQYQSNYIPIHTTVWTPLGNAILGAYNDGHSIKTVVSLPVTNGPWIIVTAPSNINQTNLKEVLDSLTKS